MHLPKSECTTIITAGENQDFVKSNLLRCIKKRQLIRNQRTSTHKEHSDNEQVCAHNMYTESLIQLYNLAVNLKK